MVNTAQKLLTCTMCSMAENSTDPREIMHHEEHEMLSGWEPAKEAKRHTTTGQCTCTTCLDILLIERDYRLRRDEYTYYDDYIWE